MNYCDRTGDENAGPNRQLVYQLSKSIVWGVMLEESKKWREGNVTWQGMGSEKVFLVTILL